MQKILSHSQKKILEMLGHTLAFSAGDEEAVVDENDLAERLDIELVARMLKTLASGYSALVKVKVPQGAGIYRSTGVRWKVITPTYCLGHRLFFSTDRHADKDSALNDQSFGIYRAPYPPLCEKIEKVFFRKFDKKSLHPYYLQDEKNIVTIHPV